MRWIALALVIAACAPLTAITTSYRDQSVSIASKALFDPARYAGTWYEIASYPTPFQKGCTRTKARYDLRTDGTLAVTNICQVDGAPKTITGTARLVGPGRLEIRLKGVPFAASYWVLWTDEDYETAVVGSPGGQGGWILNRRPEMRADRLTAAREILDFNGYDLSKLRMTPQ